MSQFLFRRVRPEDEAAVRALSARIWEGEDYVPERFQEWLTDETGQFTVVYEGEALVAFGKLTELGPDEWWLEGLRVHPDHRGRGLARRLHDYAVALADEIGRGVLRFATSSETKATHKLAETTGFKLINRRWRAEIALDKAAKGDTPPSLAPVPAADLAQVRARLQHSPYFDASHGLMEYRWKTFEIRPRLEQLQADGRLYWWRDRAGLIIFVTGEERSNLNYLDAAGAEWPALLHDVARWAAAAGSEKVQTKPLATAAARAALEAAGWELDEKELWVFERPLSE